MYTDLKKAFDTVVHSKLLHKLENIGISDDAHHLLQNYLSNRIQRVKVESPFSEPAHVKTGIPQGTLYFVI